MRVTPRSSSTRLEMTEGGDLKVWVAASPTDGQANLAVVELLAKRLGVPKSSIVIYKGESSRDKVIQIDGLTESEALSRLIRDR